MEPAVVIGTGAIAQFNGPSVPINGVAMPSLLDKVQVHDAGERIVVSSAEEATLREVMDALRLEGAEKIEKPVKIGSTWMASFFKPSVAKPS
jgi:hypothetical protein